MRKRPRFHKSEQSLRDFVPMAGPATVRRMGWDEPPKAPGRQIDPNSIEGRAIAKKILDSIK